MRIEVIVNCRAGSLIGADVPAVLAGIESAFASEHAVSVTCCEPADMTRHLEAAVARAPDGIVVGGGDGTVRTAAALLIGKPIALGIIPLGTMNRLARDLGLSLEPVEAARMLAAAPVQPIDVAEVNGQIFLCNSLIGLPVTFATGRQSLRGRGWFERLTGYVALLRTLLGTTRRIHVEIDDGERTFAVRALTIAVSNNAYSEEPSLMLTRRRLDAGELGLYVARHTSGLRLFGSVARAMLGRWRSDPEILHMTVHRLTLSSRASHLKASNDGELEQFRPPLVYAIKAKALNMLVPAAVK